LTYAHYTHRHGQYGALLRVLSGKYTARPEEFDDIVTAKPMFMQFFPLGSAITRGIFSIVGNVAVPIEAQPFPVFRSGITDDVTGKVSVWWLWDGHREWKVGELTEEQRRLSIRGVCNDTLLILRIEAGWTPENDSQ
jgi:hypothetical protein